MVTPFAGVWIEILRSAISCAFLRVTPFAGVWIEILSKPVVFVAGSVTPFAGVWIEINLGAIEAARKTRHPLRGGVD